MIKKRWAFLVLFPALDAGLYYLIFHTKLFSFWDWGSVLVSFAYTIVHLPSVAVMWAVVLGASFLGHALDAPLRLHLAAVLNLGWAAVLGFCAGWFMDAGSPRA